MTLYEHEEIARAEGKIEKAYKLVQNLLNKGFSVEDACEVAEITIEQYNEMVKL